MIKITNDDSIELMVITTIYKTESKEQKDKDGNLVQVITEDKFVRELRVPHTFSRYDLGPVSGYITTKNKTSLNRCVVYSRSTQRYYTLAHSYKEINSLLLEKQRIEVKGFKK